MCSIASSTGKPQTTLHETDVSALASSQLYAAHILLDRAYRISTVMQVYKNIDSYSAQQQEFPLNS